MGFSFSDVADWWSDQDKQTEKILDDWVMRSTSDGEIALKVVPQAAYKLASFVGSGFVDALRLGKGLAEYQATGSKWALFEDATRLLVFAGPAAKALSAGKTIAGVGAAAGIAEVAGAEGPCSFVAMQNVLSFISGKAAKMFTSLDDILKATGGINRGMWVEELLKYSPVIQRMRSLGIFAKPLGYASTIEEVVAAAKNAKGPVLFSVEWVSEIKSITPNIHEIKEAGHTFMAYKDWLGRIRFMDYANGPVGKAFATIGEAATRGGTWKNVGNFRIMNRAAEQMGQMFAFEGAGITVVETLEGIAHLAIPSRLAAVWNGGDKTPESMIDAVQDYATAKGVALPAVQVSPPPLTPVQKPADAPRSDWLTGVQYRLNHLGFKSGKVDGIMGPKTRLATRLFQKKHCKMRDGIPGPETQRRLVELCGF